MIKGITVTLFEKTKVGEDAFHKPIYSTTQVQVHDVIVEPTSANESIASGDLYGKKAQYTLHIPKGDTHNWGNSQVNFFGCAWQSFGPVVEYIEENVPGRWNKKVMVDHYE